MLCKFTIVLIVLDNCKFAQHDLLLCLASPLHGMHIVVVANIKQKGLMTVSSHFLNISCSRLNQAFLKLNLYFCRLQFSRPRSKTSQIADYNQSTDLVWLKPCRGNCVSVIIYNHGFMAPNGQPKMNARSSINIVYFIDYMLKLISIILGYGKIFKKHLSLAHNYINIIKNAVHGPFFKKSTYTMLNVFWKYTRLCFPTYLAVILRS